MLGFAEIEPSLRMAVVLMAAMPMMAGGAVGGGEAVEKVEKTAPAPEVEDSKTSESSVAEEKNKSNLNYDLD